MSSMTSAEMRLLLSDKIVEAILFFNETNDDDSRRAVEDLVDDLFETMDIEFDEDLTPDGEIVARINLYDAAEYFWGIKL